MRLAWRLWLDVTNYNSCTSPLTSTRRAIGQNWTDSAIFASFTPDCLSCLRVVLLWNVKLTAESVAAISSAAPQVRTFRVFRL